MLQSKVEAFTTDPAVTWNRVPTTCLMAVTYWMLLELNVTPTEGHFTEKLTKLNAILREVALQGTRVMRPSLADGHVHLPEGAVIVFMQTDLAQPGHACVIKKGLQVGGYNQLDWFTTPGKNHQYSEHNLDTDLDWVDRMRPLTIKRVKTFGGTEYYLYATPQEKALKVLRGYL